MEEGNPLGSGFRRQIDETIDEKRTVTNAARLAAAKEVGKQLDDRADTATKAEKDFYDAMFVALTPRPRK